MKPTIPVMHCFNNNYVIPAAVASHSMLLHASSDFHYKIYILHSDITKENQTKLRDNLKNFANADVHFIDMAHKFSELFLKTETKGHYSKEMYYKFLAPSIFTQYEKIIVSDVDVLYLGDISRNFIDFDVNAEQIIAGTPGLVKADSFITDCLRAYEKHFSPSEIDALQIGAGYYIANLKMMREDNIEKKLIEYTSKNTHRLQQPEQDALNIVCHPRIKILPANAMVCTYSYDLYESEADFAKDLRFSASEVREALLNPVQLHFAGPDKPWKKLDCTRSEDWFIALAKTNFTRDLLLSLEALLAEGRNSKSIAKIRIPFSRRQLSIAREKLPPRPS
jgi:lipopolysaccharide biosynthesis glycosyltransferase